VHCSRNEQRAYFGAVGGVPTVLVGTTLGLAATEATRSPCSGTFVVLVWTMMVCVFETRGVRNDIDRSYGKRREICKRVNPFGSVTR
jgi:hypothetical protein